MVRRMDHLESFRFMITPTSRGVVIALSTKSSALEEGRSESSELRPSKALVNLFRALRNRLRTARLEDIIIEAALPGSQLDEAMKWFFLTAVTQAGLPAKCIVSEGRFQISRKMASVRNSNHFSPQLKPTDHSFRGRAISPKSLTFSRSLPLYLPEDFYHGASEQIPYKLLRE